MGLDADPSADGQHANVAIMRSYKTEGIVLKRRNFGEADRILTIFTKYHGKIVVKAPGVRRITSRRSSHTELLNLSVFTLYKSASFHFPIVTEAQTLDQFLPIKRSLARIGLAYYICELVDRLCPENQENRKVFFLVRDMLSKLSGNDLYFSNLTIQQFNNEIIGDFENDLLIALGFLSRLNYPEDRHLFIEQILERRLYTKRLLPLFLQRA